MSAQPGQVVCFQAFRRERARGRGTARVLPYLAPRQPPAPESPFAGNGLTGREIDHRRRMLSHLAGGRDDARQA